MTQQALRQVDLTFSKQFSENETARAFLKDIGTQVNYMKRGNSGTIQRFTATGNVYKDHYNSIENIYQLQDLYKDAIGEDAVNALKILNVSYTSAAKRAMFGARDGTVDTIDGMIDLAIMLANDPGQMKEIAQQIYDNPKLLLDGAIEPFLDRYEAGDIAGAIGYALPMIVEGVAGSKGVGTGVNAVKTGAKAVVDLDIEDVTKYVDNVVDDATNRTVKVDIASAKKGTPEYEALNNPKPNTTTELSNGTTFKTGEGGFVDEVTYKPVDTPGVRDSRQTQVGKEGISGDVGGHIQACRHGGTCDRFNLFPQNSNFNNSAYKKWENEITRSLQNGDNVGNVTVKLNRADPHNVRPDSVKIEYEINGVPFEKKFSNQAGQ